VAYFLPFFALDWDGEVGGTMTRHRDDVFGADGFYDPFMWYIVGTFCDWNGYQEVEVPMVSLFRGFDWDAYMGVDLLQLEEKFCFEILVYCRWDTRERGRGQSGAECATAHLRSVDFREPSPGKTVFLYDGFESDHCGSDSIKALKMKLDQ
jgi:hypothetical protein